jgi:hypothetical protein
MTRFSVPRSRLAGTLTTPGGGSGGAPAFCRTMQQQPDAVVYRARGDKEENDE